jgi:hypothetical protein
MVIYFSSILVLLILISFSASSSTISFKEEQKKIMAQYNEINFTGQFQSGLHPHTTLNRLLVEPILTLDPILFLRKMQRVNDDLFLLIFWITFQSRWIFHCNDNLLFNGHKRFIAKITYTDYNLIVASDMLYHFKVYLMQALGTFQGDQALMLFEAEKFYTNRLKALIQELLDAHQKSREYARIKAMDRHFRFYYHCTERENIKWMITKEFHLLKLAFKTNTKKLIKKPIENMTFLAGILMYDRSTIFGLNLISDQCPRFIGYFLLMQSRQNDILNGIPVVVERPNWYRSNHIYQLFQKISIFKIPSDFAIAQPISIPKFELLNEFTNDYEDILSKRELINLAKTLYGKIILLE